MTIDSLFYAILEKKSFLLKMLYAVLKVVSFFYASILKVRDIMYRLKILPSYQVDIPVISIGNIVLGGAGKTPLTEFVAKSFSKECKTAILSRGYKRQIENEDVVCVSKGKGPLVCAKYSGDEPYLLAKHLDGVSVYVHRKRILAARTAIQEGAKLIVLDDGFQHKSLIRNEDWIVIGGRHPLGLNSLFPSGTLREPLKALKRASALFVHESIVEPELLEELCRHSDCPIIKTSTVFQGCFDISASQFAEIKGMNVAAFCGIGHPKSFYEMLENAGAKLVYTKSLSDHDTLSPLELDRIVKKAISLGAKALICTEKDIVKYPIDIDLGIDFYWASMAIDIHPESIEAWRLIRERVLQPVTTLP